jgi:hypothetical protein
MAVRIHVAWKIAALSGALAFLVLVWPTAYRYNRITLGPESLPVRINRLTGGTEILRVEGWRPVPRYGKEKSLPTSALSKLRIEQGEWSIQRLKFQLYSGSEFSVDRIIVKVQVYPAPPEKGFDPTTIGAQRDGGPACRALSPPQGMKPYTVRLYNLDTDSPPQSLAPQPFDADLGMGLPDHTAISCQIVSARGSRIR